VEFTPKNSTQNKRALLQLRALGLGLLQDGNVSVGVFAAIPRIDLSMSEMVISLIMSTVVRLALTNSCMQDQGFLDCFRRHPG